MLLFERQVASIRAGEPVSTWIDPTGVDSLRRRHLRQSFKAISHLQERLEAEWTTRRWRRGGRDGVAAASHAVERGHRR